MKWIKSSERLPEKKVFAKLHGEIGLLHTVNKDSVIFDCGGQGWRYDMTDRTVKEFEWLEESEPATSVDDYSIYKTEIAELKFYTEETSKRWSEGQETIKSLQKELEQERFNHTNTRLAWDRTCQKLYDLKALVTKQDFYNAGLMAERILHNSEMKRTGTQFAEWVSLNDWKYYPGDDLWRKRWQCQISSNDLYDKFLNHSKDESNKM